MTEADFYWSWERAILLHREAVKRFGCSECKNKYAYTYGKLLAGVLHVYYPKAVLVGALCTKRTSSSSVLAMCACVCIQLYTYFILRVLLVHVEY